MIIGVTSEQRERLEAAAKAYKDTIESVSQEVLKECKTEDDILMATAVLKVAIEQAASKLEG